MLILWFLQTATLSGGLPSTEAANKEILYKADSTDGPGASTIFSLLENKSLVAKFADVSPSFYSLNPPSYHSYKQYRVGDISVTFNDMSVPVNISSGKSWRYEGKYCIAQPSVGNITSRLMVICTTHNSSQTSAIFDYDIRLGITGFFAPCFLDKTCWYKLESKKGLLAPLTP
jgi:hypothetical protein